MTNGARSDLGRSMMIVRPLGRDRGRETGRCVSTLGDGGWAGGGDDGVRSDSDSNRTDPVGACGVVVAVGARGGSTVLA